ARVARTSPSPIRRPTEGPSTVVSLSSARPSSVKNALAASRSSTTMSTLSSRLSVISFLPALPGDSRPRRTGRKESEGSERSRRAPPSTGALRVACHKNRVRDLVGRQRGALVRRLLALPAGVSAVALRGRAEHACVLARELGHAFVPHLERRGAGVHALVQHQAPRFDQPQALLVPTGREGGHLLEMPVKRAQTHRLRLRQLLDRNRPAVVLQHSRDCPSQ